MPDLLELLPCPFCEGTRLKEDAVSNTNGQRRYIWCIECSAEGPWSTKELSARDAWNRRPQLSAALQARQGWVRVPVEPTMEMLRAAWNAAMVGRAPDEDRAVYFELHDESNNNDGWYVICDAAFGHNGCGSCTGWYKVVDDAIAAWNRRPQPTPATPAHQASASSDEPEETAAEQLVAARRDALSAAAKVCIEEADKAKDEHAFGEACALCIAAERIQRLRDTAPVGSQGGNDGM